MLQYYHNSDTYLALLQVTSIPIKPGLPSPATLLFNHLHIRGINRVSINANNDNEDFEALVERQRVKTKNYDTMRNYNSIPIRSIIAVQWQDGGHMELSSTKVTTTTMTTHIGYEWLEGWLPGTANIQRQYQSQLRSTWRTSYPGQKDRPIRGHTKAFWNQSQDKSNACIETSNNRLADLTMYWDSRTI